MPEQTKKSKKESRVRVRDLKPKKDAKGGGRMAERQAVERQAVESRNREVSRY